MSFTINCARFGVLEELSLEERPSGEALQNEDVIVECLFCERLGGSVAKSLPGTLAKQ